MLLLTDIRTPLGIGMVIVGTVIMTVSGIILYKDYKRCEKIHEENMRILNEQNEAFNNWLKRA